MISPLPVEETFDQLVNAATILIGSVFVQEVVVQQDAVFLHATQTAVQVDHLLVSRHSYPERHVEVEEGEGGVEQWDDGDEGVQHDTQ